MALCFVVFSIMELLHVFTASTCRRRRCCCAVVRPPAARHAGAIGLSTPLALIAALVLRDRACTAAVRRRRVCSLSLLLQQRLPSYRNSLRCRVFLRPIFILLPVLWVVIVGLMRIL
jgi:hypothetical protein